MRAFRQVQTAQGMASLVLNAWPLMHTTGIYQGQRAAAPNKRVFILTRSAYAGQQRNAAATWSGDITGDWDTFGRQIPAGLDFCLSGIPYWTTDIGGFFVNYPGGSENPEYRELFTRWFQWGAFCPIFRVHGTNTPKELWRFGPQYEPILVKYDNLALSAYAVYLLAGLAGDRPRRDDHARACHGLPVRCDRQRKPG